MTSAPTLTGMSPQRVVAETLRRICRELRGGKYHVHRGPVNWAAWDFAARPRVIAIQFEDSSVLREINDAIVSLECMTSLATPDGQLSDGLLDDLRADLEAVLIELTRAKNAQGDAVVIGTALKSARMREAFDADLNLQGVWVTFGVEY